MKLKSRFIVLFLLNFYIFTPVVFSVNETPTTSNPSTEIVVNFIDFIKDKIINSETIKINKKDFQANEKVEIDIKGVNPEDIGIILTDSFSQEVEIQKEIDQEKLKITPKNDFQPGVYHLKVFKKKKILLEQDFTWGVLAINTNKSIYAKNETARIDFAVLDELGNMVCDASLKLLIKNETLNIYDELSTENGKIAVNQECKFHDFTLNPDYSASYKVGDTGVYQLELTAVTRNGTHTIIDSFEVRQDIPFDIEKITATRIYPLHQYPVTLNITANRDFEGEVEESVPVNFEITQLSDTIAYSELEVEDQKKIIKWRLSLKSGQTIKVGYNYKSPLRSPQLFLLGPLKFFDFQKTINSNQNETSLNSFTEIKNENGDIIQIIPNLPDNLSETDIQSNEISVKKNLVFQEVRTWQIAVDAVNTDPFNVSGNFVVPNGVSSIIVEAWGGGGAGGGGGGVNSRGGGGGAGGQYSKKTLSVSAGTTYTVIIGAGGTGAGTGAGGVGDDTIFGSNIVVAKGGQGGQPPSTYTGGVGTTANGIGDTIYSGGSGAAGSSSSTASGGGGGGAGSIGAGGNASGTTAGIGTSNYGGNGGTGVTNNNTKGTNASSINYGGGGSGGTRNQTGGSGRQGYLQVSYNSVPQITISGYIYQTNGSLDNTVYTIALSVNNSAPVTTTSSNGYYSINIDQPESSQPLIAYISNHSNNANTITVYSSGTIPDLDLHLNQTTITNHNSSSTTNSHVCTFATYPPTSPDDKLFSCSGSLPTFNQSGVYIIKSYSPGENLDTTNLEIGTSGSFTAPDNINISGNYQNFGTFIHNSGTITLNAGTTGNILSGTMTGDSSFYNLSFSGIGGKWKPENNLTVDNTIAIGDSATFDFNSKTVSIYGGNVTTQNTGSITCSDCNAGGLELSSGDSWCNDASGITCNSSWTERQKITFDNSASNENLENFPVLIKLNSSRINYSKTQNSGQDIRFVDPSDNSTVLAHEIEEFNESGDDFIWVKVPQVNANSTTDYIWMYYGNNNVNEDTTTDDTSVWSNGYNAVWHFKETSGNVSDSVGGNTLTNYGTTTTTGKSGAGRDFIRNSNQYLSAADNSSLEFSTNPFTLSTWINAKTFGSYRQSYIAKLTQGCAWPGYDFFYDGIAARIRFEISVVHITALGTTMSTNQWYNLSTTRASDGTATIYINGNADPNTGTLSGDSSSNGALTLGRYSECGSNYFDGIMDETRISSVPRSANWLKAEYKTIDDTFVSNYNTPTGQIGGGTGEITFYNLTLNGTTSTTQINTANITVSNNLVIEQNRTLIAPSGILTINGNFTNNGTFTHNNGTVTFPDSSKVSSLNYGIGTSFYNFTVNTPSKEINFSSLYQTGIGGSFTVNGQDCSTMVKLYSTSIGDSFSINAFGSHNIQYADVRDSRAITALTANNSKTSGNNTNWTINTGSCTANQPPNSPTSLTQSKADDTVISVGNWHNSGSIKFTAQATDPNNPDTLFLCIEKKSIGISFDNTQDSCGIGVSSAGTGITLTHTIEGIGDSAYHWQARVKDNSNAYSSWVQYGNNSESETDFGIDSTPPSGGTVFDGLDLGVDRQFNDGSLSIISANWSGINSDISGLNRYEYSIGTAIGATDVVTWTNNSIGTSVSASGLDLNTSSLYFFNLRAIDNAGNTQSPVISSDSQVIAPSLSFTVSPLNLNFSNLNQINNYTVGETATLTTSTNAYNGYVIRAYITDVLKSITNPSFTISNFNGGTYSSPSEWLESYRGLGYNSSDTSIQGVNKFNNTPCLGGGNPPCFAPFSLTPPGDIVADHTDNVFGVPITNEEFFINYKVKVDSSQPASNYSTNVIYVITAKY